MWSAEACALAQAHSQITAPEHTRWHTTALDGQHKRHDTEPCESRDYSVAQMFAGLPRPVFLMLSSDGRPTVREETARATHRGWQAMSMQAVRAAISTTSGPKLACLAMPAQDTVAIAFGLRRHVPADGSVHGLHSSARLPYFVESRSARRKSRTRGSASPRPFVHLHSFRLHNRPDPTPLMYRLSAPRAPLGKHRDEAGRNDDKAPSSAC